MIEKANPGIFQRPLIKGVRDFFYNPEYDGPTEADKSIPPSDFPLLGFDGLGSLSMNKQLAETITAFYICLKIKAETFASVNTGVYKVNGERMERDMNSQLDYMLSVKPNNNQNAFDWWYATQWLEDLHGDSYSLIGRDRSGRPGELILLDPTQMSDVRQDKKTGEVYYMYKGDMYPAHKILHFKQNSKNGLKGRSDITMNRETFELSKEHEKFAKRTFGTKPQVILEEGQELDPDQAQQLAEGFVRHVKAGIPPLLYGGLKSKVFSISPGDAQYIESRQFTKAEICAIKRIPLSMIQDYSRQAGATYNNVGEQKASFYTDVLLPGCKSKELEMLTKLISRKNHRKLRVKFDHSELMRADPKTMADVMEKMVGKGLYSRNEARAKMGDNPIDPNHDEHGDRYMVQGGFVWTDQLEQFYNGKNGNNGDKNGKKNGHPISFEN